MKQNIILKIFILYFVITFIDGQCTWPSQFAFTSWTDNKRGNLTFTETRMFGWSFTKEAVLIDEWQCTNVEQFESEGYIAMRSVNSFEQFVSSYYYAYLCLKLTPITDVSYRYYVIAPPQPSLEWNRYLVQADGSSTELNSICNEQYPVTVSEYNVMIKNGQENAAFIQCPWILLGSFDYSYTDTNGGSTCTSIGDTWSMCTGTSSMAFDLSSCSVDVPYSGTGNVNCVDVVPEGSENYITVYNSGSADGINTYRFSCFAVNDALTSASVAPGYCRHDQTSTSFPIDTHQLDIAKSDIGALVPITSIHETCYTCPVPDPPDGGSVEVETDGTITKALYTCDDGYGLYGASERLCQENNNTWFGEPPVCKCEIPSAPVNGQVSVSADGSIATYTCDVGYVLIGNQYRGCQSDGNAWNGTEPTCETCSDLGDLSNGTITLLPYASSTAAIFSCDVGFSLLGVTNITCQTDGQWSDSLPMCVACQLLDVPSLGNISYSSDGLQTDARFTCSTGYKLTESGLLSCLTDGTWNGTAPSCVCEDPENPVNGEVTVDSSGLIASYICDVGYTLDGESTRECQLNGSSWSGTVPLCVTCASLPVAEGLDVIFTTDGAQTIATYSCQSGYTLVGEITATCGASGDWTQTSTSCVQCLSLTSPDSGSVTVTTNGTLSVAEYACASGYVLNGTNERICEQDGTWTETEPLCDCEVPSSIQNGDVVVDGKNAYYTCSVNYTLSGVSTLECQADGTGWSEIAPSCVGCQSLPMMEGGGVAFVSNTGLQTLAYHTCDVGYTLIGTSVLACNTDGTWNGSSPTCQLCDAIQGPENGEVNLSSDGSKTTAIFSCGIGYTVSDVTVLTTECDQTGTWSSDTIECVSCTPLSNISSGSVSTSSNGSFTTAIYTCVTGYELVGARSRTCLNTGDWSGTEPRCKCESPSSILNGAITLSSDEMLVSYTCDSGYSMSGEPNITCQPDGSGWNDLPPSCARCEDLTLPDNGYVTIATDGINSLATYTCDVGYSLDDGGSSVRTCNSDGTWADQSLNCVLCSTLTAPDSGSVVFSFNLTSTQALFSCVDGYILNGSNHLICGPTGAWDNETPTCVCDVPIAPDNGRIIVSNGGYTASYNCDVGYTLNGNSVRTCQGNGLSWAGTNPTCELCEALSSPTAENIDFTSNGTVTEVTYSCNLGYTLYSVTGEKTTTCTSDGSWESVIISCVECASLQTPSSGSLFLSTDGFKTVAEFECSSEYYLVGKNSSECDTAGQWTNASPTCVCILLMTPINGEMSVSSDNMTMTFTCDVGYTLSGSSIRTCNTDGSGWSGTQPSCDTCDPISAPVNGQLTFETNGAVTNAVFTCDTGSSMGGNRVLSCNADGSWDLNPPNCVVCPSMLDPSSGYLTVSTNGTLSQADFSCNPGYYSVGSDVTYCQVDGIWTGIEPVCVCNAPSVPSDGSIALSGDNMTVYYSCETGYTLSGQDTRTCSTDGTGWNGVSPTCVSCPSIISPTGGAVTVTTDGTTTVADVTCDVEYTISGSATLTCTSDGTWNQPTPTCVQCARLNSPDSGSVSITTNGLQTVAEYTCMSGYQINGENSLSCGTDGLWSDSEPSCVCSPPFTPTNGQLDISSDGMVVNYSCNAGYTLQGVSTRACQSNGAGWNEQQPSCETCQSLTNPTGGSLTLTTSGTVTVADVTCHTGYTINGGSLLTCRSDGSWDLSVPECGVCNSLSSPTNGAVDLLSEDSVTIANFSCNAGYSMSGAPMLTCRTDGSWDFNAPNCVKCVDINYVDAVSINEYSDGLNTYAAFTCGPGYFLSGGSILTCLADGNWDNTSPSCVCYPLNNPLNGTTTVTTDGMVSTFTCNVGFTLDGHQNATCSSDGSGWDNEIPSCVGCPELTSVTGGTVNIDTDGITTVWSVDCDVGTTLSGTSQLSCEMDGTWSSTQASCVACPTLDPPTNGDMILSTDGATTVVTFKCNVGHSMDGHMQSKCLPDGTWNSTAPNCVACDAHTPVNSGSVTYTSSSNDVTTIATFSCASGYYVNDAVNISCLSDGTWNKSQPSCVCDAPAALTNGDIWVAANGMSLVYTCITGYSLNGDNNNTCQQDSTGWKYEHPSCVQCQTVYNPANGDYSLFTDGSQTSVQYTCEAGYSLNAFDDTLTCDDDGTWEPIAIECVKCEPLVSPDSGAVELSTSGSLSIAEYTCVTGYILVGHAQRSCLTNGSWNLEEPSCVCITPTAPANGDVTISSDSITANYTCDSGYTLNGVTQRFCASDGTGWSDQEPACVTCNTLDTVASGSVELWTDGVSTFANFSCDQGFSMNGESVLQCRGDGSWNFNVPSCESCQSISVMPDGTFTFETDGITTTVTYTCDVGYTMMGSPSAYCSSAGSWSTPEPECVSCSALAPLESGYVTLSSNDTVTLAEFTCATGYRMIGDNRSICQEDGSWNSSVPSCLCDAPDPVSDGSVTVSADRIIATYACNNGYTLNGHEQRRCATDGSGWNGTKPICVICETLTSPVNGSINVYSDGVNTYVDVSCDVGYTSSGEATLTCQPDGTFDNIVPICAECQSLTTPSNGNMLLSTNNTQTSAIFTCDVGFSLKGAYEIQCLPDGSWSNSVPECQLCQHFPNIASGSYTTDTNGSFTYISAQCMAGYYLDSNPIVICQEDGTWSRDPVCLCNDPLTPDNGAVSSTGRTSTFTCDVGYSISGMPVAACGTNGEGWLTSSPVCVQCDPLSSINEGSGYITGDGNQTYVSYSCPMGYSLNGDVTNYCNADGTWTSEVPTCVMCDSLSSPDSGTVQINSDNITTVASYSCGSDYQLIGDGSRECLDNGTWTNDQPICVCIKPDTPLNGHVVVSADYLFASYACDVGYTIDGEDIRTCRTDGSGWSGVQPSCGICNSLTTPSGGAATLSTNGLVTMATFTCAEGYTMDGSNKIECRSDGSWNTSEPICVLCDGVATPENGAYTVVTDSVISTVMFTCEAGYTLKGSSNLTCSVSGTYSVAEPSCVQCSTLVAPESGMMTISTNSTITTAVFECEHGYYLNGDSMLTCDDNGNWDGVEPMCYCEPPQIISNGFFNISSDKSLAIYSCLEGYSMNGEQALACQTNSLGWNSSAPICVECDILLDPLNGSVAISTDGFTTSASVSCSVGTSLVGTPNIECTSSGVWTISSVTCVTCNELASPINGNVTFATNDTTTTATFACEEGFSLSGSSSVRCLSDGSWSGIAPICEQCQTVTSIDNGDVSLMSDGLLTSVLYSCHNNYGLQGSAYLICRTDGTWNDSIPSCVCDPPLDLIDGTYVISTDGMALTYACNVGYTMIGDAVRVCGTDSSGWSGFPPTCNKCDSLPSLPDGDVTVSTDGTTTTVTYSCYLGYSVSGDFSGTCDSNGQWNITSPNCVQCSILDGITNGEIIEVTDGVTTSVLYECTDGYYLDGNTERECVNGVWGGSIPVCLCMSPSFFADGGFISDGTTITYTCNTGYSLNGPPQRTCQDDGSGWSLTEPSCEKCESLAVPSGGNVNQSSDGHTTRAYFTCSTGYTMSGSPTLSCGSDGTWDIDAPSCGAPCVALTSPHGGHVTLESDGLTTTAVYVCDVNYTLNGVSQLSCRSDGSWDFNEATCVQCAVLSSPANGYTNVTTDGTISSATFSCHQGYYLHGDSSSICTSTGTWSNSVPTCICNAPDPITNGTIIISDGGLTATYSCSSGFTLSGDSDITCQNNYNGWTSNNTKCVSCDDIPIVSGGTFTVNTDGETSTVEFSCDEGFSVLGETNIQCNSDGQWQTTFPECVSCVDLPDIANGSVLTSTDGHITMKTYQCFLGFSLNGQSNLTCLEDGSWTSAQPTCVLCNSISTPSSGSSEAFTDSINSYMEFSCVSGYHLVGDAIISCKVDGSWNGTTPSCVCDEPAVPDNSALLFSSGGNTVNYNCNAGYTLSGQASRQCSDEGLGWLGTEPSCVRCGDLDTLNSGNETLSSDGLETTLDFSCETGFTLNGESQIACDENGIWSASVPECVSCDVINAPASGFVSVSTNGTISIATYSCDVGYVIVGEVTRRCMEDGQWTQEAPQCVCKDPAHPHDGDVVSDGYKAVYTCNSGFTLNGDYIRLCGNDSSGWNGTAPSCVACQPLSSPAGGGVFINTDGQASSAVYSCETGYTISGTSTVSCRSDGTWDFTGATCVTCDTLSLPDNGNVLLESIDSVTYANFTCDVGFTLKGFNQLTCRTSGSWDFSEPSCTQCEILPAINNGDMSVVSDGTTSFVYYKCASGYHLTGNSNRTCETDGQWTGSEPLCVCDSPSIPKNGTVVISDSSTIALFTCDIGFTMVGSSAIACHNDGTGWNASTPTCVQCDSFDVPENGSVIYSSDSSVTSVTVTCNVGSSLRGSTEIACGTSGSWQLQTDVACVSCPIIEDPVNGNTDLASNGTLSETLFSCNVGTSLSGVTEVECTEDGVWSGEAPLCLTCPSLTAPSASYKSLQLHSDTHVTTLTVSCVPGYYTPESDSINCTEGAWEYFLPQCVCDPLLAPSNGDIVISDDFMTSTFTCHVGYTMVGDAISQCMIDGSGWDTGVPVCVLCNVLTEIDSGSYNISSDGSISTVTYTCGVGFTLDGPDERQCDTTGGWTANEPTCVACQAVTDPSSGSVTITSDGLVSRASYTCVTGYKLGGTSVRECLVDGTWSSQQPVCYCSLPSSPLNGDVSYGNDVSTVIYSCDSGYTLHGHAEGLCQEDGSGWNITLPECVACSTISPSPGAVMSVSTDGVTSTASYECGVGYTLQGDTDIVCRSDGTWNTEPPSCISCDSLSLPTGSRINLTTDGAVTHATISCDSGFSLSGAQELSCRTDGSWDFSAGSCVECPAQTSPDSGHVNVTTDGSVTTAVFGCNEDYYLDGASVLTCNTDGTWNGLTPTCKCELPDSIVNGSFTISDNGLTVEFTCNVGFSMNGGNTRTCSNNGNGWSGTSPLCTKCQNLSEHYNGTISVTSDGTTTIATYECDNGYSIDGDPVIECLENGSWTVQEPTCTKCEDLSAPLNGTFQYISNGTTSSAMFTCDVGYSLVGIGEVQCGTDGSLEGTQPTCVVCPVLESPNNGVVTVSTNGSVTRATYICDPDFSLIGNQDMLCVDGLWSDTPSYCECTVFSKPNDGDIVISDDGQTASYTCDPGFTLSGEVEQVCGSQSAVTGTQSAPTCTACETLSVSGISYSYSTDGTSTTANFACDPGYTMSGEATSTCRSDGTWSSTGPTCETCEALSPPTGGNITFHSDGSITTAVVSCDSGYSLDGVVNMTCRTDGTWNFNTATCMKCPDLVSPLSGNVNITSDGSVTRATFHCFDGYYISGAQSITCEVDGTWSTESPACLCDPPNSVANGEYLISDDGQHVTYMCDLGYSLNGSSIRVCGDDGSGWSLRSPNCHKCDDLQVQANGSITLLSNGSSTSASISCDTGYSISGDPVAECQPDGTWSIAQSSCEMCEEVTQPENGEFEFLSNGTVTTTIYACEVGFTLNGSPEITCASDGSWTNPSPSCVSCPSLGNIENGMVTLTTDGSVTIARFTCDADYSLHGSGTIECTDIGSWNASTPICVCSTFSQPDNGEIVISENGTKATYICPAGFTLNGDLEQICGDTNLGVSIEPPTCITCNSFSVSSDATFELYTDGSQTVASFQCPAGYTMVGSRNLTCRTDGSWDVTPPECQTCVTLPTIAGGNIVLSTDGEQTNAEVSCDIGSTLSGQATLTCRSDGTWDFVQPECITCPDLIHPTNGLVNQTSNGHVTTAIFSCFDGYYLNGNEMLTCLEDGTWDDTSPTCLCNAPDDITNGTYTISVDAMTVTYSCDTNFTLDGTISRSCDSNGNGWTGQAPSCYMCNDLTEHTNGSITMVSDGVITSAVFTCEEGYTVSGPSVIQCTSDGTWDLEQPACEKCLDIPTPSDGTLEFKSNGTTTTAVYTCELGFTVSGASEILCSVDGSWAASIPSCVSCPEIINITNGEVAVSTNGSVTIATYTCHQDYSLQGAETLICTDTGVWQGTIPSCVCSTFLSPSDGSITISPDGTTASYDCESGFTLAGDLEQTCGDIYVGGGEITAPSCIMCDALSSTSGSTFELSTDGSQTVATYQCPVGYSMVGSSNLTCRTDGSWDTSPPNCVTCQTLPTLTDGNISFISDGEQTHAVFTCDTGATLAGQSSLSCRTDGSWDFTEPECVTCPSLNNPLNGEVNVSSNGQTSISLFSCTIGYYIFGNETLTCTESGTWNYESPLCRCTPPLDIDNGSVALSQDGLTASYICLTGFSLNGESVRTCGTDGSGWSGTKPSCEQCEAIPVSANLDSKLESDGINTLVRFTCSTGSSIQGKSSLTCISDGTWSDVFPTCVSCPTLTVDSGASLVYDSNGTVSTASFQCGEGFSLNGNLVAECKTDGTWSSSVPTCVECPTLVDPLNGEVNMSVNGDTTIAMYTCHDGYSIDGVSQLYCTTNGTWDNPVPSCECDMFMKPLNGIVTVADNGSVATFSCDEGYSLSGQQIQHCSSNAADSLVCGSISCVACVSLPSSPGSSVSISTDGVKTVADYTCDSGYVMNGERRLTCHTDATVGTWDFQPPTCVVCGLLNQPIGGYVTISSDGENTTASFSCVNGFSLTGLSNITCKSDGSWNLAQPTCDCNPPSSIQHGDIIISADKLTASYSCDVGYSMSGPEIRQCRTDGSWWDGSDPACNECSGLAIGIGMNVTYSSDGQTTSAVFSCEIGYSLSHTNNVTCINDGSWNVVSPTCVSCPQLSTSTALSFSMETDGSSTVVTFSCARGYDINGPESIRCMNNGSWSYTQPTCFKSTEQAAQIASSCSGSGPTIALGVLFGLATIAAIIFAVVAWKFWRKYKALGGHKKATYAQDEVKDNPIFSDFAIREMTRSTAPANHERHVTDMGRASTSLAPYEHGNHVLGASSVISIPSHAPVTTRNIEIQKPPSMQGSRSYPRSPVMSSTPSSLGETSLGSYLPEQIFTPRPTSSAASNISIPKINIEEATHKEDQTSRKRIRKIDKRQNSPKASPFLQSKEMKPEHVYREGSPLPQQILTPRNADDIAKESQKKSKQDKIGDKPARKPENKPKGDLIDKDRSLLKIYTKKNSNSSTPGISTRQYQQLGITNLDHDVSDVDV